MSEQATTEKDANVFLTAAAEIEKLRLEFAAQHGLNTTEASVAGEFRAVSSAETPHYPVSLIGEEGTEAEQRREAARQTYRQSVRIGQPMSSTHLGQVFERSRTWGRQRINEVREQDGMPPEDDLLGGIPKKPDQAPACHPLDDVPAEADSAPVEKPADAPVDAGGMPGKPPRAWPVLLLALPAFVSIWAGWVGLGELTGFGPVNLLPGIGAGFTINTAITLPIGVEAYAAYALRVWLSGIAPTELGRRFAMWSAIGSLALGMTGQVAFHLMSAAGMTKAPWPITTFVSCLPVVVLGCGAALAHLLHNHRRN